MKKLWSLVLILVLGVILAACGGNSEETSTSGEEEGGGEDTTVDVSRVRVVIGSSSTGGDTYQNAEAVSRYLEDELDTNMKVDAVGANRAFDELAKAKNDGSTIMFFHDMTYLGVEYGSFPEDYSLDNWTVGPVVALNQGNVFLSKADAPYNTMVEATEWLAANTGEQLTVSIEAGGVSQLMFDAYYIWVQEQYGQEVADRITVYITGSQSDKDQALWDGNADIIYGTTAANTQYAEDGVDDKIKMKFLGVASSKRMEGYEIPTLAEQGVTVDGEPFSFDKEYFFIMPKDIDENFVMNVDTAVAKIAEMTEYADDLAVNQFVVNYISMEDATDYLSEKRATLQNIIEKGPDLNSITAN